MKPVQSSGPPAAGRRYGFALAATALALAARLALDPYLHNTYPYITFVIAVVGSAWYGGWGPGLFATALSMASSEWFFVPPRHTFQIDNPADAVGPACAFLASLAIVSFSEAMRRSRVQALVERNRLQAVMEALPVGVLLVDAQGAFTEWNAAYDRIWGGPRPAPRTIDDYAAYRASWADTGSPVQPDEWAGARAVQKGETVVGQFLEIERFDGTHAFVMNSAAPILGPDGRPAGSAVAIMDVTELRHAEAALKHARDELEDRVQQRTSELNGTMVSLQREQRRLRDLLDYLAIPICLLTPDHYVAFANRAFRQAFAEPNGRHCHEFLFGHSQPCPWCRTYDVLETGKPNRWDFTSPDGRQFDVMAFPFTDEEGAALILEVDLDVTERKRAEEQLARQAAELSRSNAELQQFAYVASHDLQEPLRAVASFTKLLSERYQDRLGSDANDFIGFAVDGARRAQHLITDLLEYSRVGTRGTPFAGTDCEEVLRNALADLAIAVEDTSAEVTHDPLPLVDADETQLGQVFRNLIGNALKFHGAEAPRVHVSAERVGGEWRFSVRDNGIGIERQYAKTIFDVFQRLHTAAEYPGTGIGLAIAKKIVDRHGGRIWVESEPGKGATFYFTIPVRKEVPHAA